MTARFPLIRSLLVGLITAVAGIAASGCADPHGATDLPNVPEITQVMVFIPAAQRDYLTDHRSGLAITYATRLPIGGNRTDTQEYDLCYLFTKGDADNGLQGQPTTLCARADTVGDCTCPATVDGTALICAPSGDLAGRCVDSTTMNIPRVLHADPATPAMRVVVGKLLDGATLEHFACACQGDDLNNLKPSLCPAGKEWSDDPRDCSICGGAEDVTGRCVDTDGNKLPDFASLIPGVATITCTNIGSCPTGAGGITGWDGTAASCVFTTQEGDGFYAPSGNQFQSSVTGLGGLGPAIEINPTGTVLPTDADCFLKISDTVKFETGEGIKAPTENPTFHTDGLGLTLSKPEDTIDITNSTALVVTLTANVPLSVATFDIAVTDNNTTTTVTDTNNTATVDDQGGWEVTVRGVTLIQDHLYTIAVTGTATDQFGQRITNVDQTVNSTAIIPDMSAKR